MYKVELYIDSQRADLFQDEGIEINLTTQNISDISKVFGDYTNGFTLPASPGNNAIFKHYYNVDLQGGFQAAQRTPAFIEVNSNVFKQGVLELEQVQIKKGEAYAYSVSFYSKTTSLKDLIGDDKLNDLDLSAQNHTYTDFNIVTGLNAYVAGTGDAIIYPLISPVANWYYNSVAGDHTDANIYYHSGNHIHGVFYYDLKPAIKLQKIIDAIETKYGIEFNSDFFATADFGKLFMWCHRRAGYMFKDQPNGFIGEAIQFTTNYTGDYNLTTQTYTITAIQESESRITYSTTSTDDYKIQVFINGLLASSRNHSGSDSGIFNLGILNVGDTIQIRFSTPDTWDGSTITLNSISASVEYFYLSSWNTGDNIGRATAQTLLTDVVVADQMPEQKIVDFLSSLIKQYNLVVVPTSPTKYDVEPLDTWYSEGSTHEITQYVNTEETTIKKPSLYRRISFKYNETEAILGETYRLQNDIGYGDLQADFTFDADDFDIEVGFDNMLFERLSDQNTNGVGLTTLNVGKSITREIEPYIGSPYIFYAAGNILGSQSFSYVNMANAHFPFADYWLASNVNARVATSVTKTLNFGTEIDPYLLQGFTQSLYQNYYRDYITDLYDSSRRLFTYQAHLPLGIMLNLKNNDKLTILERNYIINNVKLNLTTGEATLELLNEV